MDDRSLDGGEEMDPEGLEPGDGVAGNVTTEDGPDGVQAGQGTTDTTTTTDNTNGTTAASTSDAPDSLVLSLDHYRDLGPLASWTVSSSKPGFGIDLVQDPSLETYWQSDGPQPHFINIHFPRLVRVRFLSIYLNFGLDESYTPSSVRVMAGMGHHTLLEIQALALREPGGWHHIDLTSRLGPRPPRLHADDDNGKDDRDDDRDDDERVERVFETRLVQLQVLANHQNGKDTHIRAIKLHGPVVPSSTTTEDGIPFHTRLFREDMLVR